jgi:hypothetical protein
MTPYIGIIMKPYTPYTIQEKSIDSKIQYNIVGPKVNLYCESQQLAVKTCNALNTAYNMAIEHTWGFNPRTVI